mmetsp:Transcript_29549/g.73751  ORF Transcript_29549/g.73751 Transcript_29549/m.73751 type:complete len:261 (+) Transcript_29549:851-1633(+)
MTPTGTYTSGVTGGRITPGCGSALPTPPSPPPNQASIMAAVLSPLLPPPPSLPLPASAPTGPNGSSSTALMTNCSGQKSCSPRWVIGTNSRACTRRVIRPSCQWTSTRVCVPMITAAGRTGIGLRSATRGAIGGGVSSLVLPASMPVDTFLLKSAAAPRLTKPPTPPPPPCVRSASANANAAAVPVFTDATAPAPVISATWAAIPADTAASANSRSTHAGSSPLSYIPSNGYIGSVLAYPSTGAVSSTMAWSPSCQHVCP